MGWITLRRLVAIVAISALAVGPGCTGSTDEPVPDHRNGTTVTAGPATPVPHSPAGRPPRVGADDGSPRLAMATVRTLAGRIGPRPATSPAYHRAVRWVARALERHGWRVRRQPVPTPAGVSWGVPVPAGRSVNLLATREPERPGRPGRADRAGRPWLLVGAHLDTVPRSPGAEDNASGVGVLLAVAAALADRSTRWPVTLAVFGSEEPRGPTDDDHHYGSRTYVGSLTDAERRGLRGMVSLDRVGVGDVVPIGSAGPRNPVVARLLAAARRAGVPTVRETGQRSSDHWSFERAGLPAARLGSTPYAGYHSPGDVPTVVDRRQLARTLRTVLGWLARG